VRSYLAIDIGAGSGRAILGTLADGRLSAEEVHRFANEPVRLRRTLYWDLPRLFHETVEGIRRAGEKTGGKLDGVGVDSWGVDFGLLDRSGEPLANPVHYRDERTAGMMAEVLQRVSREEIFAITGIQFMEINTIYQLAALRKNNPELLAAAGTLLPMADLFAYLLSGRAVAERTLASTTQLLEASSGAWSPRLLDALELPPAIFPDIVEAGSVLAPLRDEIWRAAGLVAAPPVVAVGHHDTASAVAAVPAVDGTPWGYLSSGTWSLLGVELEKPCITDESREGNFTNEAGIHGTTRFLKNISGLWLVQECRRQWAQEGEDLDYTRLAELAERCPPSPAIIDPNSPEFLTGGDMPGRIQDACRRAGHEVPQSKGEIVRCALDSLARTYGEVLEALKKTTGRRVERLHVVGGGSRHRLLNRLTADSLGIPVLVGPVEATAIGNLLIQALATGAVSDTAELRRIVARSTELEEVRPS
jgi:rhamnulokinase